MRGGGGTTSTYVQLYGTTSQVVAGRSNLSEFALGIPILEAALVCVQMKGYVHTCTCTHDPVTVTACDYWRDCGGRSYSIPIGSYGRLQIPEELWSMDLRCPPRQHVFAPE